MTNKLEIVFADSLTKDYTSAVLPVPEGHSVDELLKEILDTKDMKKIDLSPKVDMFYCSETIGDAYKVAIRLKGKVHRPIVVSARVMGQLPDTGCTMADIKKAIRFYAGEKAEQIRQDDAGFKKYYHWLVRSTLEARKKRPWRERMQLFVASMRR